MSQMLPINYREGLESDIPFIFSTWMRQAREMSRSNRGHAFLSSKIFSTHYHEMIRKILVRCEVVVACNKTDPHQMYGYIVFENNKNSNIIHMTYVKFTFRKMGIAKSLWKTAILDEKPIIHTADSYIFSKFKKENITYNPFLMWDETRELRP